MEDQSWENKGNAGLLKSMDQGLPVRVIRGHQHKSEYSPKSGYNYAGLFTVIDAWLEDGISGFKICRFRLLYCGQNEDRKTPEEIELSYAKKKKERKKGVVVRIVRDTKISRDIKKLYDGRCRAPPHCYRARALRHSPQNHSQSSPRSPKYRPS